MVKSKATLMGERLYGIDGWFKRIDTNIILCANGGNKIKAFDTENEEWIDYIYFVENDYIQALIVRRGNEMKALIPIRKLTGKGFETEMCIKEVWKRDMETTKDENEYDVLLRFIRDFFTNYTSIIRELTHNFEYEFTNMDLSSNKIERIGILTIFNGFMAISADDSLRKIILKDCDVYDIIGTFFRSNKYGRYVERKEFSGLTDYIKLKRGNKVYICDSNKSIAIEILDDNIDYLYEATINLNNYKCSEGLVADSITKRSEPIGNAICIVTGNKERVYMGDGTLIAELERRDNCPDISELYVIVDYDTIIIDRNAFGYSTSREVRKMTKKVVANIQKCAKTRAR